MNIASATNDEFLPIAINSKPCEFCGCAIDDLEDHIYLLAADLIAQWERADSRDCWRHTGEQPQPAVKPARAVAQPYRTPQSTIDAFWYVVRLDNPDYLTRWLEQHPIDAPTLCKLWEGKNARA
jgi:hypothetical protein